MNSLENKLTTKAKIKKKICLWISSGILKFYQNFRECSGLKSQADKELNKYKRNEYDLANVKENILPTIRDKVYDLRNEKELIELNFIQAITDLKAINALMYLNKYEDVLAILGKYNFTIKKEIKEQIND